MSKVISLRIDDKSYQKLVEGGVNPSERLKELVKMMVHDINVVQHKGKLDEIIRSRVKPSRIGFAQKSIRDDRDTGH